ncbi:hypothetical protein [Streptomyces sp. NBC_01485]|uniref:hypothetical protein n=1 Tax=Streptomyces sp. NBC_01485 TaxID=2903884 RepID=UPI002E37BC54|nr:hypothetical protein [Streptomyces sp. NBC_01485]
MDFVHGEDVTIAGWTISTEALSLDGGARSGSRPRERRLQPPPHRPRQRPLHEPVHRPAQQEEAGQ